MREFDVIVVGGGSAGTSAASAASKAGAKVALFNEGELGGLCILRGCMPTKTLLHSAHLLHHAAHHHTPGIGKADLSVNFSEVMGNKAAKVERFKNAKVTSVHNSQYELIAERAAFSGTDTVLAGGKTYRFTRGAVIATGSYPTTPPIPGIEEVPFISSDDVMKLTTPPKSLTVIGSGAIGLELAQFFARIGVPVSLVSRRRVFSKIDNDIADEFEAALKDEPNLTLYSPCSIISTEKKGENIELHIKDRNDNEVTISSEELLIATGRSPLVDNLNLESAEVEYSNRGVQADSGTLQTSNPNIYVAGDTTGKNQLLHVANWEGKVAGLNAYEQAPNHVVEQRLNMAAVFTDPPMATVGLTVEEAKEAGINAAVASARYPETGRAITQDVQHGVVKLVVDRDTEEIIGSQLLGPRADDIVHIISTAMYYRGKAKDLLEMPWYHPTVAEVYLSLARELA